MVRMVAAHRRFEYGIGVAPAVVESRLGGYIEFREEGYVFDRLSDRHLCRFGGAGIIFSRFSDIPQNTKHATPRKW